MGFHGLRLQRIAEDLEYSRLLDAAAKYVVAAVHQGDPDAHIISFILLSLFLIAVMLLTGARRRQSA